MTDKEYRVKELMHKLQHKNNGLQLSIHHQRIDKGVCEATVQSLGKIFKSKGGNP